MTVRIRPFVRYVPRWHGNDELPEPFAVEFYLSPTIRELEEFGNLGDLLGDEAQLERVSIAFQRVMRGPSPAVEIERMDGSVDVLDSMDKLVQFGLAEANKALLGELVVAFYEALAAARLSKKNSAPPSGGTSTTPPGPTPTAPTGGTRDGASGTQRPAAEPTVEGAPV